MDRTFYWLIRLLFASVFITIYLLLWQSLDNSSKISHNSHIIINESAAHDLKIEVVGADNANRIIIGKQRQNVLRKTSTKASEMKCNIPVLDINGSEAIQFFKPPEPLKCESNPKNWAYIDENRNFAIIPERMNATCFGLGLIRVSDDVLNRTQPVPLTEGKPLSHDFTFVSCVQGKDRWKGLLMSVVPQKAREEALKKMRQPFDWSGLDVFVLGFDSLSQMSFRRNLPQTVRFLENELGSVVLNGYNIVGDGTPQALIPILTGATELELPLTRKRFKEASFVDDAYPFAWKNFSDAGYLTTYGEDVAEYGTFTYRLKGFRHQPTDHYTQTFFQKAEKFFPNWKCHGSEPVHKPWLRYSSELLSAYPSIPKFQFMFHAILSHDDINQAAIMDDDLSSHLRFLLQKGAFNNSLVIIMSDHGNRFAQLRATHQGQLEERLPFFSLALPKTFRESDKGKQAWANLKANAARLTTPFDIHSTLLDIIHWPADFTTMQDAQTSRSLSLWRLIPESRSCAQAGIEPHWCTCLNWKDAMHSDEDRKLSIRIARAIVDAINEQTKEERNICAPLSLKHIEYAKKLLPNEGVMAYKNVKDTDGFVPDLTGTTNATFAHYQVKLATAPGRAIYEVTVLYHYMERKVQVDLSSISHVSRYGDDPHCVIDRNYFLATFCVCYDRISSSSFVIIHPYLSLIIILLLKL